MESRIEELEIRSAHQERALESLSEQVHVQHQKIDALTAQIQQLRALVQSLAPSDLAPPSEEGPPPHY